MRTSQQESSTVGQVGQVGQGGAVPAVPVGGTGTITISPVPPGAMPIVPAGPIRRGCPTYGRKKRRRVSKPSPWPPAHLALPDALEAIEAGRPEQGNPLDHSPAARLRRLLALPGVKRATDCQTEGNPANSRGNRPPGEKC
jgi:hypothetical protein